MRQYAQPHQQLKAGVEGGPGAPALAEQVVLAETGGEGGHIHELEHGEQGEAHPHEAARAKLQNQRQQPRGGKHRQQRHVGDLLGFRTHPEPRGQIAVAPDSLRTGEDLGRGGDAMGRLEGIHLLLAGEAMVFKGDAPLLQEPRGPQPPWTGVIRQIHADQANGRQGGGEGQGKRRGEGGHGQSERIPPAWRLQ